MDFSWVKQLAEQSNQHELNKQEKERRRIEDEHLTAMATIPFVEKLFLLVNACCDEFNKHAMFQDLRVTISRGVTKKSRAPYDLSLGHQPEEKAFFSFARRNSMFGIRGVNGVVEFVDKVQVSDMQSALSMRLDEMSVGAAYKLQAIVEGDPMDVRKRSVIWTYKESNLDGPALMSLCQHYFSDFIKSTDD